MAFSRQEFWSGLPFPPPGHLPNPGTDLSCFCCVDCSLLGPWGSSVSLVLVDVCALNSTQLYHVSRCVDPSPPGFPGGSEAKASAYSAGDLGSISGSGRSPREGNGNPLQYSCLENPMDGGSWLGYSPWGHKESDITGMLRRIVHLMVCRP